MPSHGKCADCRKRPAIIGLNGAWYCVSCFRDRLIEIRSMITFILELAAVGRVEDARASQQKPVDET